MKNSTVADIVFVKLNGSMVSQGLLHHDIGFQFSHGSLWDEVQQFSDEEWADGEAQTPDVEGSVAEAAPSRDPSSDYESVVDW
jgi:hypothetical protein